MDQKCNYYWAHLQRLGRFYGLQTGFADALANHCLKVTNNADERLFFPAVTAGCTSMPPAWTGGLLLKGCSTSERTLLEPWPLATTLNVGNKETKVQALNLLNKQLKKERKTATLFSENIKSLRGVPATSPQPGLDYGNRMIPGKTRSNRQAEQTPPGQCGRIPATLEDAPRMKGTPATDPQKHPRWLNFAWTIDKKRFLFQSEIQLDPAHPFSQQPGTGPPQWQITILFVFFCIVMFHRGPTTEKTSRTCV